MIGLFCLGIPLGSLLYYWVGRMQRSAWISFDRLQPHDLRAEDEHFLAATNPFPTEVHPPSCCTQCGHPLSPLQRLPLLGPWLRGGKCENCQAAVELGRVRWELVTAVLLTAFAAAYLQYHCQKTPEVVPTEFWRYGRLLTHIVLIGLLLAATGIDYRVYLIPDSITLPGMAFALAAAFISGDLQMAHLWVDWNQEVPGLIGPGIPAWMASHQHLHGLAWSLTGLLAGGGITWLVRWIASTILGQEALGFGDVTLMAMIGSFLGWQPVIFVLALAPLCGVIGSLLLRLLARKTYVPFGPYLSVAAIVVMFTWRWLWMFEVKTGPHGEFYLYSTRRMFGDPIGLAIIAGIALGALCGLLLLVRLIRGRRLSEAAS